jgi:hypothetical protein
MPLELELDDPPPEDELDDPPLDDCVLEDPPLEDDPELVEEFEEFDPQAATASAVTTSSSAVHRRGDLIVMSIALLLRFRRNERWSSAH